MSVNRTPELLSEVQAWTEEIDLSVAEGKHSVRVQWPIEGHTELLTLYGTADGTFVVEPGVGRVAAAEWLQR